METKVVFEARANVKVTYDDVHSMLGNLSKTLRKTFIDELGLDKCEIEHFTVTCETNPSKNDEEEVPTDETLDEAEYENDCEIDSTEYLIYSIMNEVDKNPEFKEALRSQLLEDFMDELRSLNYWPNQDFAKEHFENFDFSKSLILFILRNYGKN